MPHFTVTLSGRLALLFAVAIFMAGGLTWALAFFYGPFLAHAAGI